MSIGLVAIGASLGGLQALQILLASLPADFAPPVVIVQYRERGAGGDLLALLQDKSALPLIEVEDKLPIMPRRIHLAPPDYHLLVEAEMFTLSIDPPVNHARPAIDLLLVTAAEAFGRGLVGVVLTGTGEDGALGLAAVTARGGFAIVEDPASAAQPGMPAAALRAASGATVLPLAAIGPFLVRHGRGGGP